MPDEKDSAVSPEDVEKQIRDAIERVRKKFSETKEEKEEPPEKAKGAEMG